MRKSRRSGATTASPISSGSTPPASSTFGRGGAEVLLPDLHTRSGRVGGAQVAFGAPGPRIDLDRVLESWRDAAPTGPAAGASVGGSAAGAVEPVAPAQVAPAPERVAVIPADAPRTVSLPDGTTISFTVAGSALALDP